MKDTLLGSSSDPLFQESRSSRCRGKVLVLVGLLLGSGFAVLLSQVAAKDEQPAINMALAGQAMQPGKMFPQTMKAPSFMSPGAVWQSMKQDRAWPNMQPARAGASDNVDAVVVSNPVDRRAAAALVSGLAAAALMPNTAQAATRWSVGKYDSPEEAIANFERDKAQKKAIEDEKKRKASLTKEERAAEEGEKNCTCGDCCSCGCGALCTLLLRKSEAPGHQGRLRRRR